MKNILLSILFIQLIFLSNSIDLDTYYKEFIQANGYKLEENPVTTSDGYILSVWHISPKKPNGKVVFFQHGLADTAWCFFQLGAKSLPFLLLNEGFDVWLGNIRGNVFSQNHLTKNTKDLSGDFYTYTLDDFVQYDLPSMINYVKGRINGKKMSYIAHSQGSTIFLMLYMHNPKLVESSFDHFSSVGTVPNIAYTDFTPIELLDKIYGLLKLIKIFNAFHLSNTQRSLLSKFCKTAPNICGTFFDAGASIRPSKRMDYKNIYNFMYYYPGGTCKNNLLHWSQIHKMKKLVYFNPNFDSEKTAKSYNYVNLMKWKIKALIARTDDDTFSSYEDVTEFYNTVKDKSYLQILDLKNYGHLDVLAADSAYQDIFIPILNFIKN